MKAAVLDPVRGEFELREVARPPIRRGEILLRVAAASINPLDTMMRRNYGERLFKWLRRRGPRILGLDGAGVVESVGAGVRGLRAGQRVMAAVMPFRSGFYAEYVVVPAAWSAPVSASRPLDQAAAIPYAGLTAYQVLRAAGIEPGRATGMRVLVHGGSGGIGSLLVQCLHAWGAWVASTCSAGNADYVRGLGADRVIDYRREEFSEVLNGLDLVVNTVAPLDEALEEAPHLSVLRRGGCYVSLISPTLTLADKLGAPLGLAAAGAWGGAARLRWKLAGKQHRWTYFQPSGDRLRELDEWVDKAWWQPQLGERFTLDQVSDAHRRVERGPAHGKALLILDEALCRS